MVAFAPDGGGQREVLGGRDDRLFDSLDEAVDLVGAAIETDARPGLSRNRFGRDRFHDAIRDHVDRALERRVGGPHR
jgi:hypothetical protein